jgi:carbonic anhydrase
MLHIYREFFNESILQTVFHRCVFYLIILQPKAVFFTCMDSRMIPTRFTETNVGDMFIGKRT